MKIRDDIEEILLTIESNRENGATFLASLGLDALGVYAAMMREKGLKKSDVLELVKRIGDLRPSMGAIKNQAFLAYERTNELVNNRVSVPEALKTAVAEERKNLETADQVIAEFALKEIGEGGVLITCSSSDTVKRVVQSINPETICIGEGHPLNDGLKAAKWFTKEGYSTEIVPDDALPDAAEGARAVLIGADQVLTDGSVVNRYGSFPLAVGARRFGVPFYVVCQRIKLTGEDSVTIEEYSHKDMESEEKIKGVALFDVTPPDLITKIITEMGPTTAHEVGKSGLEVSY